MPKRAPKKVEHQVTATLRNWELTRRESAVEFKIKKGKEMLGTLSVGRGSLSWTPKNKKHAITKAWPDFARLIESE